MGGIRYLSIYLSIYIPNPTKPNQTQNNPTLNTLNLNFDAIMQLPQRQHKPCPTHQLTNSPNHPFTSKRRSPESPSSQL